MPSYDNMYASTGGGYSTDASEVEHNKVSNNNEKGKVYQNYKNMYPKKPSLYFGPHMLSKGEAG